MKNKGISLIVLIITIIVIIILATAIIVNLAQTDIIDNANEATVKQDFKTLQDELNLYKADVYVDTLGKFEANKLNADGTSITYTGKGTIKGENIDDILPSLEKSKYNGKVTIVNGEIVLSDDMEPQIKEWAEEIIGKTSTDSDDSLTPIAQIGTQVTTANSSITGGEFAYNNPVIPVGFKAINDGALWEDKNGDGAVDGWNDGLVIVDASGNEFVWVPCTTDGSNGTITYAKNYTYKASYSASASNTTDDTNALPMKDETTRVSETSQIDTYGGFYIGRYEAGVPANQTEEVKINGESASSSDKEGVPVTQPDAIIWRYISYGNAYTNAFKLCNSTYVKSALITGTAWDTVCEWIESEKDSEGNVIHSVSDSRTWGNHSNSLSPANVTTTTSVQTAGFSEYWKAKNIYDFAGNIWEWTTEKITGSDEPRFLRSGYFNYSGADNPASYRILDSKSATTGNYGYRIMLYIM